MTKYKWNFSKNSEIGQRYVANLSMPLSTWIVSRDSGSINEIVDLLEKYKSREQMGLKRHQLENAKSVLIIAQDFSSAKFLSMIQRGGFLFIRIAFSNFSEYLAFKNSIDNVQFEKFIREKA